METIEQPVTEPKEQITYQRKKLKAHPGRRSLPEHLPVEETIIEPDRISPAYIADYIYAYEPDLTLQEKKYPQWQIRYVLWPKKTLWHKLARRIKALKDRWL